MDMLNSDWPIGEIGVGIARPGRSTVKTMEALSGGIARSRWPASVSAPVIPRLISSYGAQQDIRIHTDDDGWVDRFVETQAPSIASWRDVDAMLVRPTPAHFRWLKVDNGRYDPVAGPTPANPCRWHRSSSCTCYMLAGAVQHNTCPGTAKSKAVGSSGLELPVGGVFRFRTAAENDRHQ